MVRFMGGRVNAALFTEYLPVIYNGHYGMVLYFFLGNLLWFMPIGYYLTKERGWSLCRTVLAGFLLSLFIEVMQYVLGTGISEVDDLILNTTGCLLGALAARRVPRHQLNEKMC
jgi:glycopeptide antibiotics resistance protein